MTTERCLICGRSLGKTLRSLVVHCMKYHDGELSVSFDGKPPSGSRLVWTAPKTP